MTDSNGRRPTARDMLTRVKVNAPAMMLQEGLLDKLLEIGVNPEVGLDCRALDDLPTGVLEKMAARLQAAGLKCSVHGPFLDLAPGASDPEILEVTRRRLGAAVEKAALFSPAHMVCHPIYEERRFGYNRRRWLEASLETWEAVARRSRELGFRLVLENVWEEKPEELAGLLEGLDDVGFCLDVGHANVFSRVDLIGWLEVLGPHLTALHLHDNHGTWDDHLAIGQGGIDFPGLFSWLDQHGIRPRVVTLEPHEEHQLWPSLEALAELWPWPLD